MHSNIQFRMHVLKDLIYVGTIEESTLQFVCGHVCLVCFPFGDTKKASNAAAGFSVMPFELEVFVTDHLNIDITKQL